MDNKHLSMVNGQWSMVNGIWSMVNGQVNGHRFIAAAARNCDCIWFEYS
jgi:hypothetical protein